MSHVAFARKYRPRTFDEVVGQEAIAQALKGAVAASRTASVYLFSGSHGVGKTSMARILAKALNCPTSQDGEPCLECPTCLSIDAGRAMDVLEIDAASNRKIDDARQIREDVRYRAQGMRFKVYILDEVHQFTKEAFDALLKTFEEAPDHVRLILATTELRKVPSTIRSRAQVFHFRRNTRADIELRLRQIAEAEGVTLSDGAVDLISRRARGSMRDGQKMLDQVVILGSQDGQELTTEDAARLLGGFTPERIHTLLGALAVGDTATLLGEIGVYFADGGYAGTFLEELQDALRAVLYLKTCGPTSPLLAESNYAQESLAPAAEALSEEGILYCLTLLAEVEQKLRIAKPREPRVLIEVALVRLARANELRPIGEVLARLERLERALGGAAPSGASGAAPSDPSSRRRPGAGETKPPAKAPQRPPTATADRGRQASYSYPGSDVASKRAVAEAQREDGRAAAPPPAPPAPRSLHAGAVHEAWNAMRRRLSDSDKLGMTAEVLERGNPEVRLDPDGVIRIRVTLRTMLWEQLNEARNIERISELFARRLGMPAPIELQRIEPVEKGPESGGAGSVYDEDLVKLAAREFDARPLGGG